MTQTRQDEKTKRLSFANGSVCKYPFQRAAGGGMIVTQLLTVTAALSIMGLQLVISHLTGLDYEILRPAPVIAAENLLGKQETVKYLLNMIDGYKGPWESSSTMRYEYDLSTDTLKQTQIMPTGTRIEQTFRLRDIIVNGTEVPTSGDGDKYLRITLDARYGQSGTYKSSDGTVEPTSGTNLIGLSVIDSIRAKDPYAAYKLEKAFLHLYTIVKKQADPFFVGPVETSNRERNQTESTQERPGTTYDPCKHVYVGKRFEGRNMFGLRQTYIVMGYSSNSGKATTTNQNDRSVTQELDCSQIPE